MPLRCLHENEKVLINQQLTLWQEVGGNSHTYHSNRYSSASNNCNAIHAS